MIENFLIILAFNWFVVTLLWFSTLKIKRADFIDIYWGPSFFFSALMISPFLGRQKSFLQVDDDLLSIQSHNSNTLVL